MATSDILTRVRIKSVLISDPELGVQDIGVDVTGGVAVLTGEVETPEQKEAAEELTAEVPNVLAVRNELEVTGAEAGYVR